jgi:hypothetical protein
MVSCERKPGREALRRSVVDSGVYLKRDGEAGTGR